MAHRYCLTLHGVKKEIASLGKIVGARLEDRTTVSYTLDSDIVEFYQLSPLDFVREDHTHKIRVRKNLIGYTIGPDIPPGVKTIGYMNNTTYAAYVSLQEVKRDIRQAKEQKPISKAVERMLKIEPCTVFDAIPTAVKEKNVDTVAITGSVTLSELNSMNPLKVKGSIVDVVIPKTK